MIEGKAVRPCIWSLLLTLGIAAAASAQSGSSSASIAGLVRDESGAVLPGVSIEASSSALIEKVRTAVTDGSGYYQVIDLRPGVYQVTFTLAGFRTVVREGIVLSTGFTATVNADLAVGALEETVVVSGASPIVDTRNVRQQSILTDEVIASIPVARGISPLAELTPGLSSVDGGRAFTDVGGLSAEGSRLQYHGSSERDGAILINGLPWNASNATNAAGMRGDTSIVEEFNLQLGGISAEFREGGVVMNMIAKEGGNAFSGNFTSIYGDENLQTSNLDDELRGRNVLVANSMVKVWDHGLVLGGPIKRDSLWFFGNLRYWGTDNLVAGVFHDMDVKDNIYTPDLSRPGHDKARHFSQSVRVTWQAAEKQKFQVFVWNLGREDFASSVFGTSSITAAPEAQVRQRWGAPNRYYQANWSSPMTSKLLVEAGYARYRHVNDRVPPEEVTPDRYSIQEQSTGLRYNAPPALSWQDSTNHNLRASAAYVTGSHSMKIGITWERGFNETLRTVPNNITLRVNRGVPNRITMETTPRRNKPLYDPALGIFAQDQWTLSRLTVNAGIRYDYLQAEVPAQRAPAVQFLSAADYPEVRNVPRWKDLSPRLGVAFDLFGTGRTAVKGSLSRYVGSQQVAIAGQNDPRNLVVNTVNRNWTDLNGDFMPQCDFLAPAGNGECGPLGDLAFGTQRITTEYDSAYLEGWGVRPYNWALETSVQHEVMPQVSMSVGYARRWFGNFEASENTLVVPADFDPYCITAPSDPRLPGGGGEQICGLYDVSPARFGQSFTRFTAAERFGEREQVYDGIDVNISARLQSNVFLQGGVNAGRTRTSACFAIDSPQQLRFCESHPPFQPNVKFLGSIALPWQVDASAVFQSMPGYEILATYEASNAEIAPSLGRSLSSGANGTAPVELVPPGTMYGDRMYLWNVRVSRLFRVGPTRVRANIDVYNLFNANTVQFGSNTFGPAWQQPTYILPARLAKIGVQVDF